MGYSGTILFPGHHTGKATVTTVKLFPFSGTSQFNSLQLSASLSVQGRCYSTRSVVENDMKCKLTEKNKMKDHLLNTVSREKRKNARFE
jgi:hypothetical protein